MFKAHIGISNKPVIVLFMNKIVLVFLLASLLLNSCTGIIEGSAVVQEDDFNRAEEAMVKRPFPQHIRYADESILPNHKSQAELDADVTAFYDYWKATYLVNNGEVAAGNALYRVAFGKSGTARDNTVSEGQGFGMLILPVMAGYDPQAQEIFDGLWRFARQHPSVVDPRLMDWNVSDEDDNDSAFDGDADMALGLLLADAQWGSGRAINYKAEALILITAIRESTIGSDSRLPMLGDWVEMNGETYNQYTVRSSDFMLSNFKTFANATSDPLWNEVIANSQQVMRSLQQNYSPQAGLLPDFIILAGDARVPQPSGEDFLEGPFDGSFNYNAGRVPWRVASHALLSGDETSAAIVRSISIWAEQTTGGNPAAFRAGYSLEGAPVRDSDYFSTFFVSPLGVAAMTNPDQQQWLNAVYETVAHTHADYYEDTVNLLCLIVMSGNAWIL